VTKWRSRFVARRLEGLADEPRPGAARTITDEQVEQVLVATLETTPTDATHWSTRSLARQLGMSQSAISRIWRAFGLKPHLVDTFKLSTDPQFIEKVRDVVGLYLNPPKAALVLCGREDERAGAGPHRPDPAAAARDPAAGDPRRHPPRDHQPVRRVGGGQRQGHLAADRAASRD